MTRRAMAPTPSRRPGAAHRINDGLLTQAQMSLLIDQYELAMATHRDWLLAAGDHHATHIAWATDDAPAREANRAASEVVGRC